jgi:hypothetical protein
MVREYVLSNAHNSSLTPEFATSFCPSYFAAREVTVAPIVFATKQVIQTNGFAYGSSPITRLKRVRIAMPQSFQHGRKMHLVGEGEGNYYTISF